MDKAACTERAKTMAYNGLERESNLSKFILILFQILLIYYETV